MADNKEWMESYVNFAWSSVKEALQENSISSSAQCPTDISLKEGDSGIQYEVTIPGTYSPSLSRTEHGYMPTVALSVDCNLTFKLLRSSKNGTETGSGTCTISVSSNSNSRSYTITTGGSIDG